ncbi:MAG: endonuclease MutS2 [Candidatus Marinimicrobia bacterium]|nr:endonuclease MutS2 [Candidatus Neomarinimicrobiota bacterium]MCF7829440.1 endonuclease MutS2 [Candidatus Neomarinimicrobiota bacterium]MCF7880926.1 endonuclease MutS2 [Candidatus Neomarinimicrobiota bacterium]
MDWQQYAFDDLGYSRIKKFIAQHCLSETATTQAETLTPLSSIDAISERQDAVTDFADLLEFDDPFPIQRISDAADHLQHAAIENAFLKPEALLEIAKILSVSRNCQSYLQERKHQYPALKRIVQPITAHKSLEENIEEKIEPNGDIPDSASNTLRKIRREILRQESAIREQMESLTRQYSDAGMLQEGRATIRGGRLVVPVKMAYKNKIKGIVHDQSASGQTYFIEPMAIVEGNNRLKELQMDEQEEIERILRNLTAQVGAVAEDIRRNQECVLRMDLLHAMAEYSLEIDAVPPIISESHQVDLNQVRNPLLINSEKEVVPNSIAFGDEANVVLITGPNAGGKTVTLKTVGLLTLMGMTGLHIPAEEGSVVPLVDAIFVDIGDRQSLENDLSTFSSHIERISDILEHATERSLVLLDELGTGTDPTEGAALARAILERLLEKNVLGIATTHHGALKAFAHNTEGLINGAMQFNQEDLSPTYVLHLGRPGSSYALEIAGRVGMQPDVIDQARHYLDSSKEALEDLIVQLEQQSESLEKEQSEVASTKTKYENLKHEYETKVEKIRQEVKKAKKIAAEDAQKILDESSRKIEEAIRKIKESDASTESIKEAKQMVSKQKEKIAETTEEVTEEPQDNGNPVDVESLHEGDLVYVQQFDRMGTVLDEPSGNQRIQVDVDGKKMELPAAFLREPSESQAEQQESKQSKRNSGSTSRVTLSEEKSMTNRIDIRGQRVDEARSTLEQFYNHALVNNLNQLEIIHGKGTGALQNLVDEFLSQQRQVKSHRLGEIEEGGAGVTIAELV